MKANISFPKWTVGAAIMGAYACAVLLGEGPNEWAYLSWSKAQFRYVYDQAQREHPGMIIDFMVMVHPWYCVEPRQYLPDAVLFGLLVFMVVAWYLFGSPIGKRRSLR